MSEIRVDKIISHAGNSAPDLPQGATISGVTTVSTLSATTVSATTVNATTLGAGVTLANIDSVGILTARAGIKLTQTQSKINLNTTDGSDNKYLSLGGGGDASQSRGAGITLYGNEVSSHEGRLQILAGNSGNTNGVIQLHTGGSERVRVGSSGQIGIGGANYGTSGQVLTSQGNGAAPQWAAPAAGLSEVDQWYLTSTKSLGGNATEILISTNLTRAGTSNGNFAVKGTGMSYATGTGIWTFPSTGYWQLSYTLIFDNISEGNSIQYGWQQTTNNSTYTEAVQHGTEHFGNSSYHDQVSSTNMFRITDVSNQKVKFWVYHNGGAAVQIFGGAQDQASSVSKTASSFSFIKLSDV